MYEREMAQKNLIMKVLVGSHLYGTETEKSDKDFVGIFIPDKDYVVGIKTVEQVEIRTNSSGSGHRNTAEDTDTVLYSLPKFIHLAANNNPNIVELFFAPDKNILVDTEFGKQLRNAFPYFISKKVKHTFCGYAFSQKRKLLYKNFEGGRKAVVEEFGYETKFASHILRLLTEGIDLLMDGKLTFPLSSRDLVKAIKRGYHDLNYVLSKSDSYEKLIEEAFVRSSLPQSPNLKEINNLQINLLENYWNRGK